MSPYVFSALFVAGCVLALGTLNVLSRPSAHAAPAARFAPLDGLRGYAAFAVFFDHAIFWHTYSLTGKWGYETDLAWTLGSTAVSLFFMVTAFLFVEKVVGSSSRTDWLRLYVSRFLRIVPLFLFAFAAVLTIVAAKTSVLQEPPKDLLVHIAQWLPLTAYGTPAINRLPDTWLTLCHVTWTLPYECLFYLALPAIAVCSGRRVGIGVTVGASAAALALLLTSVLPDSSWNEVLTRLSAFPAGAAVARMSRSERWRDLAVGRPAAVVALLALALSVFLPVHHSKVWRVFFPAIAFAVIASGNTLFGFLTSRSARLFGQISYSIYLLHGLLLYLVIGQLIGPGVTASLPTALYWCLVFALIPVLILASFASYRSIELPAMSRTDRWTASLRQRFAAGGRSAAPEAQRPGTSAQR